MMSSDGEGTKISSRFWNSSRKVDMPVESLVVMSSKDSGGEKLRERKSLNFRNDPGNVT